MKMKKMLAILAALSVLGTTGLTVGAEDTATTTEPATEASTTTETEAETTAAETTAETETTVETAAAEENQTVKEEGTKKVLTSKTIDFGQHTSDPNVFTDETLSVEVYYLLNEEEGPVYLSISINGVASNLTGIVVKNSSLAGDPPSIEALCNIDNYFKQSGENSISINVCGTWTEYDYVGGQFVPAGTAPTTPEDNAIEVTPRMSLTVTGTVTYEQDASLSKNQQLVLKLDKPFYATYNYENSNLNGKTELVDSVQIWTDDKYAVGDRITVTGLVTEPLTAYYVRNISLSECTITKLNSGETTTATTEDETTTTTTTTTKRDDAHPIDGYYPNGDFQLDGVTLTPKVEYSNKEPGLDEAWLYLNIYSQDGTLLVSVPADTYIADDGRPENYGKVGRYLVKTGSNTITVIDYSGSTRKYHSYVFENGKFVSTGTTTDDNQEKTFTVEIPYAYFTVIDSVTGEVVTTPGANKSMVNAAVTSCTNGNVASLNYGNEVSNNLDAFLQSITVSDVKPGTLTIKGTCQSYSSLTPEEKAAGYTTLPHCGDAIENYFTLTVTIDENGNIVTGDSGKTDNGSASNAPATKNTSGTPKTGDMTTVPAVAVGLTLTAAGVVAFISKRKK